MDNSTTSGSLEELKEESNLIIYIVAVDTVDNMEGNSDVQSASTLEAQAIGETGGEPAAVKQNTTPFFPQSDTHSRAVWLMYLAKGLGTDL